MPAARARREHTETVQALIEAGADINLQNIASFFILFIVAPFGLLH